MKDEEESGPAALQHDLFGEPVAAPASKAPNASNAAARGSKIKPQLPSDEVLALAAALPAQARLGCSSWSYPGWRGLVWDGEYSETLLSRHGLAAYDQQPLMRAISIDRGFYQPLTASQYQRYASQVSADFRFTVKAPALVSDAQIRTENGRGREANPAFLDPTLAVQQFIEPALEGLGSKIGALVFQLSPLSGSQLSRMNEQFERLERMLDALPSLTSAAPEAAIAVEVRDPQWLQPRLVELLRAQGATYCLGLHPKLPPIEDQLWLLRALWPGPLVCRWNLNACHGPFGYEDAEKKYGDFSRIIDPDPATRAVLAKVIRGTTAAGRPAYVTVSNQAEGCGPLSVQALAREIINPG